MATTFQRLVATLDINGSTQQTVGLASYTTQLAKNYNRTFSTGTTGALTSTRICTVSGTTDGTGVTYDFKAMPGSTDGATAVDFTRINGVIVVNTSTSNTLRVGNSGTNFFTGCFYDATSSITVPVATLSGSTTYGSPVVLLNSAAGIATAADSKLLKIVAGASGTTTTYDLIVWGIGT